MGRFQTDAWNKPLGIAQPAGGGRRAAAGLRNSRLLSEQLLNLKRHNARLKKMVTATCLLSNGV